MTQTATLRQRIVGIDRLVPLLDGTEGPYLYKERHMPSPRTWIGLGHVHS